MNNFTFIYYSVVHSNDIKMNPSTKTRNMHLYKQQKEAIRQLQKKITINVKFDQNNVLSHAVRETLFGDGNTLIVSNIMTLQQQTLILAIYINVMTNFMSNVEDALNNFINKLVFYGMYNMTPIDRTNSYSFVTNHNPPANNLTHQYHYIDEPVGNQLNAKHLQEDVSILPKQTFNLTSFDIIGAIYGLNAKTQASLNCSEVCTGKITCHDYIINKIKSDVQLTDTLMPMRFWNLYISNFTNKYIPITEYIILLMNQFHNSSFYQNVTNDTNKYIYTPKYTIIPDEPISRIIVDNCEVETYHNYNDFIKKHGNLTELFAGKNGFGVSTSLFVQNARNVNVDNNPLFCIAMKYDFENDTIGNQILSDNIIEISKYQSIYEYGIILAFPRTLLLSTDCLVEATKGNGLSGSHYQISNVDVVKKFFCRSNATAIIYNKNQSKINTFY